jgi:hypothetical protein
MEQDISGGSENELHPDLAAKIRLAEIEKENLELQNANLQLQLELAKISQANQVSGPTPTSALGPDLVIDRTAVYDPESAIGKQITVFLKQDKLVSKPITLIGSANYAAWKESILSQAESVRCHYILTNKKTESPSQDEKTLWEQQNSWLYDLI